MRFLRRRWRGYTRTQHAYGPYCWCGPLAVGIETDGEVSVVHLRHFFGGKTVIEPPTFLSATVPEFI